MAAGRKDGGGFAESRMHGGSGAGLWGFPTAALKAEKRRRDGNVEMRMPAMARAVWAAALRFLFFFLYSISCPADFCGVGADFELL
jgi:hypothetical protein